MTTKERTEIRESYPIATYNFHIGEALLIKHIDTEIERIYYTLFSGEMSPLYYSKIYYDIDGFPYIIVPSYRNRKVYLKDCLRTDI